MTLRIQTMRSGPRVAFHLIGRIQAENLADLKCRISGGAQPVVLDLDEITLVDLEVVRFLRDAEAAGIELSHCPPFVREWIERERAVDS